MLVFLPITVDREVICEEVESRFRIHIEHNRYHGSEPASYKVRLERVTTDAWVPLEEVAEYIHPTLASGGTAVLETSGGGVFVKTLVPVFEVSGTNLDTIATQLSQEHPYIKVETIADLMSELILSKSF